MTGRAAAMTGSAVLVLAWAGPLPAMATSFFTAHMALHLLVVCVAAPLLGWALAGKGHVPPLLASLLEFILVWTWHVPALHEAARFSLTMFVLEQLSFAAAGTVLWASAFREPAGGVAALFLTAMHMTLLGALLTLAPRPLYSALCLGGGGLSPLEDQQLGGVLMAVVGGGADLLGALWLGYRLLREKGT